jgi:hypothetical protein
MNVLKAWFLGRLLREKILVFAFVLLGALIWLSSAADGMKANVRRFRAANSDLGTQALWLNNRATIEAAAAEAASHLDPSKTYDATFLVSEVSGMARRAGLSANTEPPRTQRSPQFAIHTLQLTTRRADLGAVLRFYQELAGKAPYLGLEQISVQGDRSAPGMLNATLQVASVELLGTVAVPRRAAPAPAATPIPVAPVEQPAAPAPNFTPAPAAPTEATPPPPATVQDSPAVVAPEPTTNIPDAADELLAKALKQ